MPPLVYRRYVDDSFLIFKNRDEITPFFNYMNNLHENIKFTKEVQHGNYFLFLDVKITIHNDTFITSTYYKPTHTGLYTNWHSFTPRKYKINLIKTLLNRAYNICSNEVLFKSDYEVIKQNLIKNLYPPSLIDSVFKNFIKNKSLPSSSNNKTPTPATTVDKKIVLLILPFHGNISDKFERSLKKLFCDALPQVDFKIVFRTTCRVADLFKFKDKIPKRFLSSLVYGIYCKNCPSFYVGKTKRHLETRFKEHRNIRKPTAVTEHLIEHGHSINFDDVKVLTKGDNDIELLIKETLTCRQLKPDLNVNVKSYPLEIF